MSSLRFTPVAETSHQALLIWPRFAWIRQLFCDWVWHLAWIKTWTENRESHLLLFKHTVRALLMEFDLPGGYCVCMSPYVHWLDNNLHCICVQSDTLSVFRGLQSLHTKTSRPIFGCQGHTFDPLSFRFASRSLASSHVCTYMSRLCVFFLFSFHFMKRQRKQKIFN